VSLKRIQRDEVFCEAMKGVAITAMNPQRGAPETLCLLCRHLDNAALDRDLAVQQIVSRAVVSTEIVDILKAAGITSPDISILSDEFLAEVQQIDKKNLALEALRKLRCSGPKSERNRHPWRRQAQAHCP
jgi:restriction endonuclease HindI-like protein